MQYLNYHECKQRGTIDFPIEFHHVDKEHPHYNMAYHWHMEYEIIRILKGSFLVTLDEQEFLAKEHDVLFIPAGMLHAGIPDHCVYECAIFDINMLLKNNSVCKKYLTDIMQHSIVIQNFLPRSLSKIHTIVWSLFSALSKKKSGYELITQGTLYEFFGIILQNHYYEMNPSITPHGHKRVLQLKKVLEFIENSYDQTITLEELSKEIGMSPKYFCRFFQEMTHRTPIDYLNYYRIEHACYELSTEDSSITEVAFNCGFNDISYFIKTFKKYKGTTPKKYMKSSSLPS